MHIVCISPCNLQVIQLSFLCVQLKEGQPDRAAFESLIDTEIPEAQRATAKQLLGFCFENHGEFNEIGLIIMTIVTHF